MGKISNYINFKRTEKRIAKIFNTKVKKFTIVEKLAAVIYLTPAVFSLKNSLLRTNKYILLDTLLTSSVYAEKLLRDKYKMFGNYVHREVVGRVIRCYSEYYGITEKEKFHVLKERVSIFEDIFDDWKTPIHTLKKNAVDECVIMSSYDLTDSLFTDYTKNAPLTILPIEYQFSLEINTSRYLNMMFDTLEKLVFMAPSYDIESFDIPDFVKKSNVRQACSPTFSSFNKK